MKTGTARLCAFLFAAVITSLTAFARDDVPIVKYDPSLTMVEGDQPLHRTVVMTITAPFNLTPGQKVLVRPVAIATTKPAGVSDTVAASYVSFSPATLEFTEPNQALTTTITADFPLGTAAGEFIYRIETQGWAAGTQDPFAGLNANVYPQKGGDVPTIALSNPIDGDVFTYEPAVGPLTIPFQFTASAPPVTPITSLDPKLDGNTLSFTRTDNADGTLTGSGSLTITTPGAYKITASATNSLGTSTDSAEFTVVVSAPPPTVTIAQPTGPSYTIVTGTTLNLPYAFSATSIYGNITELTATLNGAPVTFTPTGLNSLLASGAGNFAITTPGNYALVVTATNPYGSSTATREFNVAAATPVPTVTISQPANGTVFTRIANSAPTAVPFTFTAVANAGFTISAVTATLNGSPVTFTPSGLNTANAGGTGTLSISTPGTYVLVATGTSSGVTASASTTFKVTETQPPPSKCDIVWLPPISLNKVQKGGSVLPIKFKLCCDDHGRCSHGHSHHGNSGCDRNGSYNCDNGQHYGWGRSSDNEIHANCKGDRDTSVVIAIYEVFANGSTSAPTLYAYDRCSPNPPTYTIQGNNMYHLNFPVPKGKHTFRVEVYRAPSSSTTPQLLGSKEFTSK
jgi:hypothetical protein